MFKYGSAPPPPLDRGAQYEIKNIARQTDDSSSSNNNEHPCYVRVFSLMVLCGILRNIDKNKLVGACAAKNR